MQGPIVIVLACLLSACGMKGELYEAPPPAEPSIPATDDPDKGERKTIPSTPDPAKSE